MVKWSDRRPLSALLACALGALATLGCGKPPGEAERPAVNGEHRQIVALGRLKPKAGVLEISAVPGNVLKNFAEGVEENAFVQAGDELARVNSYDLLQTQVEAAVKKRELGKRQWEQEIAVAEAELQRALASEAEVKAKLDELTAQGEALGSLAEAARIAQDDYEHLVELQATDPELVTEQEMRRKRNEVDQATHEYDVKQRTHAAGLRAAQAAVEAAAKGVVLARLNLQLAKETNRNVVAEIEEKMARRTLDQSILRAPQTEGGPKQFKILKMLLEPGEAVTQFPVLQIADVSEMVCIAEVYEADAKRIVDDQSVVIHSPALAKGFGIETDADGKVSGGIAGKVVRIGSLVSGAGLMQRNPLAPSDRSIIEVVIAIDPQDVDATAEAARHIDMQVTVYFGEKPKTAGANASREDAEAPAATP
jgi:HlyD family secretion protein